MKISINLSGIGIVFLVLKLVGVINWSWWWVLCPFWIPLLVALMFFTIAGILFVLSN